MSDPTLRNVAADAAAADLATNAWYAIGDGPLTGDQVSNERLQPAYNTASGGVAALTATLSFTGTGSAAVTDLLVYDAQAAGNFRFSVELSGDQTFNAAGELDLTAAPITVT
jgi:hypothetical protein